MKWTDSLDAATTVILIAKLGSVAIALNSAEYLARPTNLKDAGLMSWEVGRVRNKWLCRGRIGRVLHAALRYPAVLSLLALRLGLALTVLFSPPEWTLSPWLLIPAAFAEALFVIRTAYGLDGADQMSWISLAGLALVSLAPVERVEQAFLFFLAFQVCLSYVTAGTAKVSAAGWRDGTYITAIAGLRIYGNRPLAAFFRARPTVASVAGWGILLWEILFPLVLVAPAQLTSAFLISGIIFHALNAAVMGLNAFFWAFIATYPAVLYTVSQRPW